jgi:CDP-diacylglycerol--glycerol-3-phosphate 3-phosphatidyltransferase
MNLPTWITVSRLLGVPFLLYLLYQPTEQRRWIACIIFLVAAGTDWVDGYLARRLNQVTDLGKFLDPLVDKLLVLAPLLSLIELGQVPAWGVFLILARELTIAGWRVNQTTISGANLWGKLKTVTQIAAIALLIAPLPVEGKSVAIGTFWVAVALTLISGAIYIFPAQKENPSQG